MCIPAFSRRFLPRLAALVLAGLVSGCSVAGMLPGGYRLFPPEYYFEYEIRVDPGAPGEAGALCREEPACFEKRGVALSWGLDQDGVRFQIRNGTERPLRILWPEASILEEGEWKPVVVAVGYPRKNVEPPLDLPRQPPLPTAVAPGTVASFLVFPQPRAAWREFSNSPEGRGFWRAEAPLWGLAPAESNTLDEMRARARQAVGRHVRTEIPLEIEGARRDWSFALAVTDAQVKRVRW
jgi:hypothetical protein